MNLFKFRKTSKSGFFLLFNLSLISILIAGLVWYYLANPKNSTNSDNPQITSLIVDISNLDTQTPLTILDSQSKALTIFDSQKTELLSGTYTLKVAVDNLGSLNKILKVKPDQTNRYSFALNTKDKPKSSQNSSAKALTNIQKIDSLDKSKLAFEEDSSKIQLSDIQLSNVVTNPNQDVYAVIIDSASSSSPNSSTSASNSSSPNLQSLAIITKTNPASSPNSSSNSNSNSNSSPNPNSSNSSSSSSSNSNSNSTSTTLNTITISSGCTFQRLNFNQEGTQLRYFKLCPELGQNGFFNYDLNKGQETQLLQTSNPSNLLRVAFHPSQEVLVYTKPEGEFGYIIDQKVYPILPNSDFGSIVFSPDGQYIITVKNKTVPNPKDFRDTFAQEVIQIKWDDLLTKKDQVDQKVLGQTFYIPRAEQKFNLFWQWIDQNSLYIADSPNIFVLNSTPKEPNNLPKSYKGGQILETDKSLYTLFNAIIYSSENQEISENIDQVIYTPKGFYYLQNNYLYRIQDNQPVQAYDQKLALAFYQNSKMYLITSQGQILQTSI